MTTFTRITVIGSSKRATVVVPSDEPVGALVPEIADLIAEPYTTDRMTLVGPLGQEIELAASADDLGLVDGNTLRLVSVADVAAPPEVTDVTDAVAEGLDTSSGRWNGTHRTVAGATALGSLSLAATLTVATATPWFAVVVFAVSAVLGAVIGRVLSRAGGLLGVATSLGAVPATAAAAESALPSPAQSTFALILIALGLAWVAIGVGIGMAGERAALTGAITGVVLSGAGLLGSSLGLPPVGTASLLAVIVTAALGALPMLALSASQLTTLDDVVIAGSAAERSTVEQRIIEAYAVFGWAVFAIAGVAAVTLVTLLMADGVWPWILAAALLLVVLLRTRVMPLAYQAWPLWAAAGAGGTLGVVLGGHLSTTALLLGCALAAILTIALVVFEPRIHTRVRLRRFGDLIEGLAVLVMVPALLGVFGVYDLMLGVFP